MVERLVGVVFNRMSKIVPNRHICYIMTGYQKLYRSIALLTLLLLLFMAWANAVIKNTSKPYLLDSVEQLSGFRVGLLLGTRKNLQNGEPNEFFFNRIDATTELYKNRKITYMA